MLSDDDIKAIDKIIQERIHAPLRRISVALESMAADDAPEGPSES